LEAKGTADTILGKAVSVGAKGADSVLHVVGTAGKAADNVINSPAGADFGNRFGKLIDNLSQDVPERAKSSGAFDDLAIVESSFDEKGRPTGAKVRLSPVVKGVGDLAKRELAGFKKVKMQHQKNKALSQMTSLANTDNECVERLDGYKDVAAVENRLAAMSESNGNPVTISDFAADIKSRMEGHVSGSKRLSDDEMDALRADAALLGIGGDVVDTMTKGSSIGGFADSMFSDASDRMERRTSERNAIQGHRDLIQARASAIIARAETVDPQFAEEAQQHWAGLQTDRVLTSGEREMRKAGTVAAGVAKQAVGVVGAANGVSTIQNLADGGRLGAGTLGDTSDSGVYEEWADYSIDQQEKSAQSDEIGILASATAGANEASDTPDADLADLAEKKKSRDIANLDTVMNS
jgi:hypothetical protein